MTETLSHNVLVTGAAGFIGSHLTDRLLNQNLEVVGFDNLSSGSMSNLTLGRRNSHFRFVEGDLLDYETASTALGACQLVYHLAADPEVRLGAQNPKGHFEQNLQATFNLLEAIRKRGVPTKIAFASTSTVYGEASKIPTPEDYGPLLPISTYGATKLGCEALMSSYTQLLPLQVVIFRFANIVGSRARHGVLYDFIMKLKADPRRLEVLGDGTQSKSYLHVDDCIDAFVMALEEKFSSGPVEVYNIGTEGQTNVMKIARIIVETMNLGKVAIKTTGGRAWPGDVTKMQLDISKIRRHGWKPKHDSNEAVRLAVEQLIGETTRLGNPV